MSEELSPFTIERREQDEIGFYWREVVSLESGSYMGERALRTGLDGRGGQEGLYRVIEHRGSGVSVDEYTVGSRIELDIERAPRRRLVPDAVVGDAEADRADALADIGDLPAIEVPQ